MLKRHLIRLSKSLELKNDAELANSANLFIPRQVGPSAVPTLIQCYTSQLK
jgi:hypothetical protein